MDAHTLFQHLRDSFGEDVEELIDSSTPPTIRLRTSALLDVMRELKNAEDFSFEYLQLITGVDYLTHFEVVYHLTSIRLGHSIAIKIHVDRENPTVPSVSHLWPAANWHEREQFDLMGVVFDGHPDLRRILCPEDWEGHPLRKDYVQPLEYHGISNVRKVGDDWYPKHDEDAKAILKPKPSPPASVSGTNQPSTTETKKT